MKNYLALVFMLGAYMVQAQSDNPVCGTSAADQRMYEDRLRANIETVEKGLLEDRGTTMYVPVHFHLVGDASGNGRARELRVLEQLCAMNAAYASMGVQFYLSPHPSYGLFDKSISSDGVYYDQSSVFLMQTKRHQNAINYYLSSVAASGGGGPGETQAYYSPAQDWIVSRIAKINGNANNSTIPHETGHFFSLDHPFLGWESTEGFKPGYPGWPVAPVLAPDGGFTERQNGTNCTTAADLVCDTPPDYKFGFTQSGCAPYAGGAKDPLSTLVDPMENNYMSYFEACSTYVFTPMQQALILADLSSSQRNFLDNTFTPVATSIDTPTDLLTAPDAGATTQYYNSVMLEWKPVDGATHFVIEVDDLSSFLSPNLKSYVTDATSYLLTNLLPNKTYYWRVKPFNYYVGCATPRSRSLKTSGVATTAVTEITGLNSWQISPNPADDLAIITVEADAAFEAGVRIMDAAGRLILNLPSQQFLEGQSAVQIPVQNLHNGFYFVQISDGRAYDVRKLVISRN